MTARSEPVGTCGCQLVRTEKGLEMVDCPLHKAAPEMADFLVTVARECDWAAARFDVKHMNVDRNSMQQVADQARALLDRVGKPGNPGAWHGYQPHRS